jgi:hypothetical protein
MVFPLGHVQRRRSGRAANERLRWITDVGRWWLLIALAAWIAVACGELHHAFSEAAVE